MKKLVKLFAQTNNKRTENLLGKFVAKKIEVDNLPEMSELGKATFTHDVDMSHLYYSSKIEGTILTNKQMREVSHD